MIDDVFEQCVWYQSKSIKDNPKNPMFDKCLIQCDGYNTKCLIYTPRKNYFKQKLMEVKRT